MSGRPKKVYTPLNRDLYIKDESQVRILIETITLLCPECGSWEVGEYGTEQCGNTRFFYYECKKSNFDWRKTHPTGKLFKLITSALFKQEI